MWQQPIIPPQLNKNVLKIKGFVTVWDFICGFIFGTLSGLTGWSLPFLGWIWQTLIAIFIMMFLCSFLIPLKNKRIYTYIYLWIKFIFSNKNYRAKGLNNTKLLIPYKKVVEDFIYTGKEYIGAIRLGGFNLANLALEEQNIKIEKLRQLFKLIDTEISLLKLEQPLHLTNNEQFLKTTIKSLKQNKSLNKQQKQTRTKQLTAYLSNFADEGILSTNQLEKHYYLLIYSSSIKECKKWLNLALDKVHSANLTPKMLNYYELVNVIKQLLNPYVLNYDKKTIDEYKNNLSELFKFDTIKFKADYVIANKTYFYQTQIISNLPPFPQRAWSLPLMDSDGSVIINISPVKSSSIKHRLAKSIGNLATNMVTASKKDVVGQKEQEHKLEIYHELVSQIGYGMETIKKMNIVIMHYGQSKRELLNKQQFFNNILRDNEMKSDRLIFEQVEGYSAMLPKKVNPLHQKFSYEVPSLTLAEAFPFITNTLKDEKGLYLGENLIGEPIVLDQFKSVKEDKQRKNHNMMIIGQTGSGKTTLASKIINFHLALGRKVIIIDPEREYKKLCEYYDGNWVDIGNSTYGQINPLQIFGAITEDNEVSNKTQLISHHIQFLENWLNILFADLTGNVLRYFSQVLGNLYTQLFDKETNILNLEPTAYPTFSDLQQFLINNPNNKVEYEIIKELISNEFTGVGKYATLYNGHSTIKTNDNLLHVFDINSLYEKGHHQTINAQLYLLTTFISHEIKDNGFNEKNEVIILIDEAHLLIDSNKPIALDFIFQMVKRIRKRYGGIILVTQNPDDFLGNEEIRKKTMAIINNLQYSFIMNLSPKNLEDVNNMYKSFGGLSEPQSNFIAHAQTGDALLINGGFERHEVTIKVSQEEISAFTNNQERDENE